VVKIDSLGAASVLDAVSIPNSPYTLGNVTTYTIHGQGAGTSLTVQTTGLTAVTVPAPSGVVLALAGVPLAGFGCWLRRRKTA
jgi:hypothetical protein